MTPTQYPARLRVASDSDRSQVISNGVLGMLLFVISETVLFGGMISGFLIIQATAPIWPPPGQPRLPVEATAFNTAVLFLSAFALANAHRHLKQMDRAGAEKALTWALALGAFFVVFQGYEWVQLIYEGLTLTSSTLGALRSMPRSDSAVPDRRMKSMTSSASSAWVGGCGIPGAGLSCFSASVIHFSNSVVKRRTCCSR